MPTGGFAHIWALKRYTGSIRGEWMSHSLFSSLGDKLLWTWIAFRSCVYGFNCYLIMLHRLKWAVTFSEGWSYFSPFHFNMCITKDHIFGNGSSVLLMTGIRGISLMEMFKECVYFLSVFLITSHGIEMSVSLSHGAHSAFSLLIQMWHLVADRH